MYRVYVLFTCCMLILVAGCTKEKIVEVAGPVVIDVDTVYVTQPAQVDTVYITEPPTVEYKDFKIDLEVYGRVACNDEYFAHQFCVGVGYDDVYKMYCEYYGGIDYLDMVTCQRTR